MYANAYYKKPTVVGEPTQNLSQGTMNAEELAR